MTVRDDTCPACHDAGFITVRVTTRTGKGTAEHDTTMRPCPFGCQPDERLKGNETTLDDLAAFVGDDEGGPAPKPKRVVGDYGRIEQTFDIADWYGIQKKEA